MHRSASTLGSSRGGGSVPQPPMLASPPAEAEEPLAAGKPAGGAAAAGNAAAEEGARVDAILSEARRCGYVRADDGGVLAALPLPPITCPSLPSSPLCAAEVELHNCSADTLQLLLHVAVELVLRRLHARDDGGGQLVAVLQRAQQLLRAAGLR
ncbi:MAG: hypothetical protein VX017_10295, partial [Pseudomonadota bacterium]|nr:hypothetical protein [Pseudomonadota bacterium]